MTTDAATLAAIRDLFATFPGWRDYDEDYTPDALLARIATLVGEPLDHSQPSDKETRR